MTDPTNNTKTTRCHDIRFLNKLPLVLVVVFVIMMVIISIAWLAMHPHDPSFGVTSLSLTNFSISDLQVRGKYKVGLTITNQNKIKTQVMLHRVAMLQLHGKDQEWHSEAMVQQQDLLLEKKTNKSVKVEMEVRELHKKVVVGPEVLVKEWNEGVVNFDVVLSVTVRFEAGMWPSSDKLLDVWCMDLHVGFLSPTKDTGKLLGAGKDCYTMRV